MITAGFTLHADGITCHACGRRSYTTSHRAHRYCGRCNDFHACRVCGQGPIEREVVYFPTELETLMAMLAAHRDPTAADGHHYRSWPSFWACRGCAKAVHDALDETLAPSLAEALSPTLDEALAMTGERWAEVCRELVRAAGERGR
ncbi:MAG: hypothetical protein ACRDYA_16895 [Egibacteraceae bacterium]